MKPTAKSFGVLRMKILRAICFASALLCIGCSQMPHRTILITDSGGRPICGAGVSPYPILLRNMILRDSTRYAANSTDINGQVAIYDVIPGGKYTIGAPGFISRSIEFPANDSVEYRLKRNR